MRLHPLLCPWLLALTLVLAAAPRRAVGADNPIKMGVSSPLALARTEKLLVVQTRFARWFPVAVTLTNSGPEVHGSLSLKLNASSGNNRSTSDFSTEVDLPTGARKVVWLYGRIEREENDSAEVVLRGRGIQALRAPLDLRPVHSGTRLVLTISDNDEKLSFLKGLAGPGLGLVDELQEANLPPMPGGSRNLVQPLGATHDLLPSRWIGLEAADLVVLHDFPHNALRPEQIEALRGYVAGGGALLAIGGSNWQRLAQSPLADLWPVTPQASSAASSTETATLVERYVTTAQLNGADRLGGATAVLVRGPLKPGARLLAGNSAAPLLAVGNTGAGRVVLLAADPTNPPFKGWSGNAELWADIFSATQRTRHLESVGADRNQYGYNNNTGNPYGIQQQPDTLTGLLASLGAAPQLRTPPVSYIAWFLALYVFFLVPLNYCVLRFFDKRELAWVTVPVIVVAFSVMSYAAALSIKGRDVLTRQVTIVQGSGGSGAARADALLWLFSPRKTAYTLSGEGSPLVLADYLTGDDDSDINGRVSIRQREGSGFTVENAAVNMWASRTFVGQTILNTGKGINIVPNGGRPSVANGTPFDLRGAVLVTGGQVRPLGSLKAGGTATVTEVFEGVTAVDPNETGRIDRASNLDQVFPKTPTSEPASIARQALGAALGPDFGKTNPGTLLIGWSDRAAAPLSLKDEAPHAQNVTLFVFRLNPDPALEAPSTHRQHAQRAPSREAIVRLAGRESLEVNPDADSGAVLTYHAQLISPAQPATLTVAAHGRIGDPGYYNNRYRRPPAKVGTTAKPQTKPSGPVAFYLWDFARHQWQPLQGALGGGQGQNTAWKFTATVAADNFVRQPDGRVRIRAVTRSGGIFVDTLNLRAS